MAEFDILVDKKGVNRNDPFNEKTAYRVRTDDEADYNAEKYRTKFLSSTAQMASLAEFDDKVNQILYDRLKITSPSIVHDFIEDTDRKYYNKYSFNKKIELTNNNLRVYNEPNKAPKQEGFDRNILTGHLVDDNRVVFGSNHANERLQWKIGEINRIIEQNPNVFSEEDLALLNYENYQNKLKDELKFLEKEQKITSEFNEGKNLLFFEPGAWGDFVGTIKDPALLSAMPLSFAFGTASVGITAVIKMALWEAAIAGAAETGIQYNAVDYSKHLDGEYGWNEARQTIGMAAAGAAVGTFAIAGLFKGIKSVYVKGLQSSKNKRINDIANKINDIIETKGESEESLKEVLDVINVEIDKLNTAEKKQVLKLLPDDYKKPFVKTTQKVLEGDEIVDNSNPMESTIPAVKEHNERIQKAKQDIINNNSISLDDETINKINFNKNYDEGKVLRDQRLDPDEITVDAKTFQFKKVDYDPKSGVSTKLKDVKVWDQDSAETVLVFQKLDGTNVIADGHQRLGLAKRIKSEGKQKPYLLANIYREADGYRPEQIMVRAMIKNVRTGTASAVDVAKILRQSDLFIENLTQSISPTSKLWRNAVQLSNLSDDAFGYFLNNGINDDIAALVGNLVTDPKLQIQVMDFLAKSNIKPGRQMEFAVRDLLSQGVGERQVQDLFGTETIRELLFNERATVLDIALRDINRDKRLAKYLVNNEGDIISKGKNKLDTKTNKKIGKESELLYEYVKKNAYMKGEISDELTKAAKLYKAGNKQEAVRAFKEFISRRIKEGDITRDSGVGTERNPFLEGYSQDKTKKPKITEDISELESSKDPLDGQIQYNKEYGSIEDAIDNIFNKLKEKPKLEKIDLSTKTLSELSELDDDILKNQADELVNHPEIDRIRKEIDDLNLKPTIEKAGGKFSEEWKNKRGWNKIVDDIYKEGAEKQERKLTVFIGLPASGKSTVANAQKKKLGAIIIDSDDVKIHPNLADDYMGGKGAFAVHAESKEIQSIIMERAFNNGDNIIVPIVGSSGRSIDNIIDAAKQYDYSLVVKYVEVDEATAITRNIKRIESTGRFVDPKYIQESYQGAIQNYNKGKEVADGYEKINLEGNRPVTTEIGGTAQADRGIRQSDVGELSYESEAAEIEEILTSVDPEYKIFYGLDEQGQIQEETISKAMKEIFDDKNAIDFLKNCKGLK